MKHGLIHKYPSILDIFYRLTDMLCVIIVLVGIHEAYPSAGNLEYHMYPALAGAILFSLAGEINRLYHSWRGATLFQQATRIFYSWLATLLVLFVLMFATQTAENFSRVVIGTWILATPLALICWRAILNRIFSVLRRNGRNIRQVAIAGAGDLGARIARSIVQEPAMGMHVEAFYDDNRPIDYRPVDEIQCKVAGDLDQLAEDAGDGRFDVVYIALPLWAHDRMKQLVYALGEYPVRVYVVPDIFIFDMLHARMTDVGGIPAFSILDTPYYGVSGWMKRLEDIVMASGILLVAALPMVVIAIGIKLTSPGPVIFKQRRYGLDNKEIRIWKFRTMTVCEDDASFQQVTCNDPRVTRIGGFLRRTSMDELPQFFNVLGGTMSVVGPRPHAVAHDHQFRDRINYYMSRLRINPGITGWAQINGWRGETDTIKKMEKRVEYDLEYIRNWSLMLDFKIIYKTVWSVIGGKGAY